MFGKLVHSKQMCAWDCVLASLAAMVLLFGIWPDPLFDMMHASVEQLAQHISVSKLP